MIWTSERLSREGEAQGHIISERSHRKSGHTVQRVEDFNFLTLSTEGQPLMESQLGLDPSLQWGIEK